MRGKATCSQFLEKRIRITPAYAGKSHPLLPPPFHDIGSPPPMRGKAVSHAKIQHWKRITPAYAGKRDPVSVTVFRSTGSPPPMRGKASRSRRFCSLTGITPAYAGKSYYQNQRGIRAEDHPRLCGEKVILNRFTAFTIGSPPPMRGKD